MSYPFTATSYTNLNIIQNGNFKEYSLQLLNSGDISFNTDITLNFTLVGGGGGGGGGGHNTMAGSVSVPKYPSGGGASGGASGTYKINLSAYDSHIYNVGIGASGGTANNRGGFGQTSYIDFQGNNILDRVDASGGNPGNGHFNGNFAGAYVESPNITGPDVIKIVDSSGGAGGDGVSYDNIGLSGNGTDGSPNNTTSYNINYTNTTYLGSGGGGADAKDTSNPIAPPVAGNGGGGGNGSSGGAVGTGSDNTTPTPNGGMGKDGNVPGAGGGGGGQPGTNSTTDGGSSYKVTSGGSGADGAIYIWFKVYTPPPNGCDWNPDLSGQTTIWTRYNGDCVDLSGAKLNGSHMTRADLSEKRKAVIFQYKNNSAGFSKKQQFSRLSRGLGKPRGKTYATQGYNVTNPNVQNLPLVGKNVPTVVDDGTGNFVTQDVFMGTTLVCAGANKISGLTTQNDTPGPTRTITNYPTVPLTNYIVQRTYRGGSEKWPQYGPNTGQPRLPKYARNTGTKPGMNFWRPGSS